MDKYTDDELREILGKNGISAEDITNREELEGRLQLVVAAAKRALRNSNSTSDADLAGFNPGTLSPISVSEANITQLFSEKPNEGTTGTTNVIPAISEADLTQLANEVAKRRRYKELEEELRSLDLERSQSQHSRGPQQLNDILHHQPRHDPQPRAQPIIRASAEDVANAVDIFTGDDSYSINSFISNLNAMALSFGWSDAQTAIYGRRFVAGTAKALLRASNVQTWPEICRELRAEFGSTISTAAVHKKLATRKRDKLETQQQYAIAMRQIAANADIDESTLVSYIIDGISTNTNVRLFFAGANTINELRVLINRFNLREADDIRTPSTIRPSYNNNKNPFSPNVASRVKCFNCGESGHFSSSCSKGRRPIACFVCGQEGHFQSHCPKTQTANIDFDERWQQQQYFRAPIHRSGFYNPPAPEVPRRQTPAVPEQGTSPCVSEQAQTNNSGGYQMDQTNGGYTFVEGVSLHFIDEMTVYRAEIFSLLDTGSADNFIQAKYVPKHCIKNRVEGFEFVGLNKSPINVIGSVTCSMKFRGESLFDILFHVVENGTMYLPVILGRPFMEQARLRLTEIKQNPVVILAEEVLKSTSLDEAFIFQKEIFNIDISCIADDNKYEVNHNIPHSFKEELNMLIKSCTSSKIQYDNEPSQVKCAIRITKDEPFFCSPRRLSYSEKSSVRKILDELLDQGVIRPSHSPYSSPIVLVRKKNSSNLRMCVDYRRLNKLSARDNYPLPLIEDQMDQLNNKTYFSCIDLKNGFHHVAMETKSIPLTSFVTPHGQFEYMRMPFGLKIAPSVFSRYIYSIFRSLIDTNKILVYMDDIMVATENIHEHITILREVFELIDRHKLKLKLEKCKFFVREIDYLGYRVDSNGILPNPENIDAVRGFPQPTNVHEVHSFLGLSSYFRKFIKNFAIIAKPLYELLKKGSIFNFGETETEAFQFLKKCLSSTPVLAIYSPTDETELHCDASSIGYGAILLQRKSDKKFHPVYYFSKRTTEAESRYHSFELETLAIVNALKRFRVYLEGIPFKIVTDCNSLTLTLSKKQINPRIARWGLELENFNYSIEHRRNEQMRHVDSLSRLPEVNVIERNSLDHILAVEQGRDHNILKLRKYLEESPRKPSSFELQDGLVYKRIEDKLLFYVPSILESNVIRANHDDFGHFGVEKVNRLIRKIYWFPGMQRKIELHIKNCLQCIQFAPNAGKTEGELHNIPKGSLPFQTIHIDHLGPLEVTKHKHKHIFAVVDGFTKFIKLFPVKTTSSKEVIGCLTKYFQAYSRPVRIVSDRGTAFTSNEFKEFSEENNITHIKVATASPQSNGQVERYNRIIVPLLAKISDSQMWNYHLPDVEFAMNNTINRSIDNTPSILLFGIHQRGKVVDKVGEQLAEQANNNIERDIKVIREKATSAIEKVQQTNKTAYDSIHKKPRQYKINDFVMLANFDCTPGINKKLLPKYRGPYCVTKVLPNDRYIVEDIDNWQITQRPYQGIHAPAQMRPWILPETDSFEGGGNL